MRTVPKYPPLIFDGDSMPRVNTTTFSNQVVVLRAEATNIALDATVSKIKDGESKGFVHYKGKKVRVQRSDNRCFWHGSLK